MTPYDEGFGGPDFFERSEYRIEGVQREAHMSNDVAEALTEVDYQWQRVRDTQTMMAHGAALIELSNAVSNLRTWHPGYREEDGTLPWERDYED